jgi:hypothetical protein
MCLVHAGLMSVPPSDVKPGAGILLARTIVVGIVLFVAWNKKFLCAFIHNVPIKPYGGISGTLRGDRLINRRRRGRLIAVHHRRRLAVDVALATAPSTTRKSTSQGGSRPPLFHDSAEPPTRWKSTSKRPFAAMQQQRQHRAANSTDGRKGSAKLVKPEAKPMRKRAKCWSGRRESNPRMQLGKLPFYH